MNQGVQGKCITNKATPTRTTPFSKEKETALGGTQTHDTLLTRQSALPSMVHFPHSMLLDATSLSHIHLGEHKYCSLTCTKLYMYIGIILKSTACMAMHKYVKGSLISIVYV